MLFRTKNVEFKEPVTKVEELKDHLFLKVVNIPEKLEGDKEFYATKHMDYLKEVYADFVEEYSDERGVFTLGDMIDDIKNIKTVGEWKTSKDVADFEEIAKEVINQLDYLPQEYDALDKDSYITHELSRNGEIMMNLDKFCFDNYDNFEEAVAKAIDELEVRSQSTLMSIDIYGGGIKEYQRLENIADFSERLEGLKELEFEKDFFDIIKE